MKKVDYIAEMTRRINNYYENAQIDYGVTGEVLAVTTHDGIMIVIWVENGTRYMGIMHHYEDYTPEQIYNIWMETGLTGIVLPD